MKALNILFTGVGGTGVLTAARILAAAALAEGHNVRVGEIHGMAQRGGAVTCSVRIGANVHGPIISTGMADVLVSAEPVEALRQADKVKPQGTILVGMYRIMPTAVSLGRATYPENDEILRDLERFARVVTIDAGRLAKEAGSILTINIVLLGALFGLGQLPVSKGTIISALKENLPEKFHQMNLEALTKGMEAVSAEPS